MRSPGQFAMGLLIMVGCASPPTATPLTAAETLARIEQNLAGAAELKARFRGPLPSPEGLFKIRGQDQFHLRAPDGFFLISDGKNAVLQDEKVRYGIPRPAEPGAARHTLGLFTRSPYAMVWFLFLHTGELMLEIEGGCWEFFKVSDVRFADRESLHYTVTYTYGGSSNAFHVQLWFDPGRLVPVRKRVIKASGEQLGVWGDETYEIDLHPGLTDADFVIPPDPMQVDFERK